MGDLSPPEGNGSMYACCSLQTTLTEWKGDPMTAGPPDDLLEGISR